MTAYRVAGNGLVPGALMEHGMKNDQTEVCGSTDVEFMGKWLMILGTKDQRLADEFMKGTLPRE